MTKIWCLFSIANEYDQPDNNLVAAFEAKPQIQDLAKILFDYSLEALKDDQIIGLVDILKGEEYRRYGNHDIRLEEIELGVALDNWE